MKLSPEKVFMEKENYITHWNGRKRLISFHFTIIKVSIKQSTMSSDCMEKHKLILVTFMTHDAQ